MARRLHPHSSSSAPVRLTTRTLSLKTFMLLLVLVLLAIPTFLYAARFGNNIFPSITQFFYKISGPPPPPTPTPPPPFTSVLPQAGSILYTVQEGDSCDEILYTQMHFHDAGRVFSDVNANTVNALNDALGHDCHAIQPGITLPLSPQYPLIAFGGIVLKIDAATPQQLLPTPLINVPNQAQYGPDCSGGCLLTVRVTPHVQVHLTVQTTLSIKVGAWIWTQAMLARKSVAGFSDYPYADPKASMDGMSLRACDFQVDTTHDDNSLSCEDLTPNTIKDDGGAWLLSVTGPGALDHWRYPLQLPPGTRVMLWLSNENGALKFHPGNPVYRYDDATHLYVKV